MATSLLPPTVELQVSKMCFLLERLRKLIMKRWTQDKQLKERKTLHFVRAKSVQVL